MNRKTGVFWEGEAETPERACELTGFPPEDCWIRVCSPDSGPHHGGGWKQVPGYPRGY